MKKKLLVLVMTAAFAMSFMACASKEASVDTKTEEKVETVASTENTEESSEAIKTEEETANTAVLEDGVYQVDFNTDSSMFKVNETCEGHGTLTVSNGEMTVHITLVSQNIVNLYPGLAKDAQKEGAILLQPTLEEVTYEDGLTEEVNSFDVPVPYLDEEFDLALIGTKGTWYDHKVSVSNPVK